MSEIHTDDVPLPVASKVRSALALNDDDRSTDDWNEIEEAAKWALHNLPEGLNFIELCTRHPINQVYFRAGLLACREYMARFVEQGGDAQTAQSIRANWWPRLGADPGPPRLFQFDEVCDEIEGPDGKPQWKSKDISISVEALPRAYGFLNAPIEATGLPPGKTLPSPVRDWNRKGTEEMTLPCSRCGGEGKLYASRYGGNDPDVWATGMCPVCEGSCTQVCEARGCKEAAVGFNDDGEALCGDCLLEWATEQSELSEELP